MARGINSVTLVGNLTRDPELRSLPSGTAVCSLRIAVNTSRKDGSTGEWTEKPNYFDVTVWGAQGENVARYMSKGRPVGVQGRLEWREWQDKDGNKRQSVEIVADFVQFLSAKGDDGGGGSGFQAREDTGGFSASGGEQPAAAPSGSGSGEDDIPF